MNVSSVWIKESIFEGSISSGKIKITEAAPEELLLLSLASSCAEDVAERLKMHGKCFDTFEVLATATPNQNIPEEVFSEVKLTFNFSGSCARIAIVNAVEHSQYLSRHIGFLLHNLFIVRWVIEIDGHTIAEGIANYCDVIPEEKRAQINQDWE